MGSYIVDTKPTTFMLENVAALVQPRHADDFDSIMSVLHAIPDKSGRPFYRIVYKVVDPTDVGIPQSRPRLFIVGISAKHEQARKRFMFPSKGLAQPLRPWTISSTMMLPDLQTYRDLIRSRTFLLAHTKIMAAGSPAGVLTADEWIIDMAGRTPSAMRNKCPCITNAHAGGSGYYSTRRRRRLTLPELMRLQGIDPRRLVFRRM